MLSWEPNRCFASVLCEGLEEVLARDSKKCFLGNQKGDCELGTKEVLARESKKCCELGIEKVGPRRVLPNL